MTISIHDQGLKHNCAHRFSFEWMSQVFPLETVEQAVRTFALVQEKRERKLNLTFMVYLLIAWGLWANMRLHHAASQLTHAWRQHLGAQDAVLPAPSAFSYRRHQLGAGPLAHVMRQCCHPLADPVRHPWAFFDGYRLVAVDGTVETVADTPDLARICGYHSGKNGKAAFPQLRGTYLVECGTHAILDAVFLPCWVDERVSVTWVLDKLCSGMLILWDRGFHSYELIDQVLQRGAQVLGRIQSTVKPTKRERLPDGSWLVDIFPSDPQARKRGESLRLRLIEYRLTDARLPDADKEHRLLTSVLDWQQAPGVQVAEAYHERWEIEATIDEVDTHERDLRPVLHSQSFAMVVQECYGLVLAHYLVRCLMLQSAEQSQMDVDRISFVGAIRLLRQYVPTLQEATPEERSARQQRLVQEVARERLPKRRFRLNPRAVKRRYAPYKVKKPEMCLKEQFDKNARFVDMILLI